MKPIAPIQIKATVSAKGQVVIPLLLRDRLGIHAGTELIFTMHDDVLEIKPLKRSIEMLFGCCKKAGEQPMSIEEMDMAIAKTVLENDNRTRPKKKRRKKA